MDWFKPLFGFKESTTGSAQSYSENKAKFKLLEDPPRIQSQRGDRTEYLIGHFSNPKLSELRSTAMAAIAANPGVLEGPMQVDHASGDISLLMGSNPNSVIQAASQFNVLEFPTPDLKPEKGVTDYSRDKTQGPCVSISCGPATVYRNYFVEVPVRDSDGNQTGTQEGQTAEHQIENLFEVSQALGNVPNNQYFEVRNGYTFATNAQLTELSNALQSADREQLKSELRVGVHADCQVTSTDWGRKLISDPTHTCTQIFVSACSIAYSGNSTDLWAPFASLILEACYEATLWAAVQHALNHKDDPRARTVILTAVGGGVFGNEMSWIASAINMAIERVEAAGVGLDIKINSYAAPPLHRPNFKSLSSIRDRAQVIKPGSKVSFKIFHNYIIQMLSIVII